MPTCKGCGAYIKWIKTSAGKMVPVDGNPVLYVPVGGTETIVTMFGEVISGCKTGTSEQFKIFKTFKPLTGYCPHWASCKDSKNFKR